MQLIVDVQGSVHGLYDEVIDLTTLGSLTIRRASHVEPDGHGQWYADLSPVDGPTLGPFDRRSEALEAEQRWLEQFAPFTETIRCYSLRQAPEEGGP